MIGITLVVLGIIMFFVGVIFFNPKRGETMLIPFINIVLGIRYIFLGIPHIQDPPWREVIEDIFWIITAITIASKATSWAIKRTDIFKSFKKTLELIPEITQTLKSIETILKGSKK